jgi:hypothetical protein
VGLLYIGDNPNLPRYDSDFMVGKLPTEWRLELIRRQHKGWSASAYFNLGGGGLNDQQYHGFGDNQEDALCNLCIELFKGGILPKEDRVETTKNPPKPQKGIL